MSYSIIRFILVAVLDVLIIGCVSVSKQKPEKTISLTEKQALHSWSEITAAFPDLPWQNFYEVVASLCPKHSILSLQFQLLSGGYSGDVLFRVESEKKNYVLRFLGNQRPHNAKETVSEIYRWASQHGVGPKLVAIDKNSSFLLTEFVAGRTLDLKDTKDEKILTALARTLWTVHHSSFTDQHLPEMSQFIIGRRWYKSVKSRTDKAYGPTALQEAYKYWEKLNKELDQHPMPKSMLHNDPNLKNIIWHQGKITLLDWELAGVSDPRRELAHVISWFGLNERLTKVFLTAHFGRAPTPQEIELIKKAQLSILLEFAWVGLSSLSTTNNLNQKEWDEAYALADAQKIESLSIIQMTSNEKPHDERLRLLFLGLVKEFMLQVDKSLKLKKPSA